MIPNKRTVAKLKKIEKYILEEPKRLNMRFWGAHTNKPSAIDDLFNEGVVGAALKEQNPPCGTIGCIAGTACVVAKDVKIPKKSDFFNFPANTPVKARKWLGISNQDSHKLFYLSEMGFTEGWCWPAKFEDRLAKFKPGTKGYAKVVVARIEHYIKTGE